MKFKNLDIVNDYGKASFNSISSVERELGVKFPKTYFYLMREHNGVNFKQDSFDYFDVYYDELSVGEILFKIFPKNESDSSIEDIRTQYSNVQPYGYDYIITFGRTANGDYVCFDYREDPKGNNPKIVLLHHDIYDDETNKMLVSFVANNFDEFLGKLYNFEERYPEYV